MTKSPRKLVLHKQTLRALTSMELRRAAGGDSPLEVQERTFDKACPLAANITTPK
jgi:hypothetical protein